MSAMLPGKLDNSGIYFSKETALYCQVEVLRRYLDLVGT